MYIFAKNIFMKKIGYKIILLLFNLLIISSCIKDIDLYKGKTSSTTTVAYSSYIYPFKDEIKDATAEITIKSNVVIDFNQIASEIPFLKYNKSWLLMLTQDDCKHAAYCRTWAAINGKPISSSDLFPTTPNSHELYYDAEQLEADDLPPTVIPAGETLGCTDGNGNEVRFAITTTLSPESSWMNAETNVNRGFTDNYYRFFMKSGLTWNDVIEMLNYGTGIAFHDVNTSDVYTSVDILNHYKIAQDTILKRLSGRGCKMLAEPNGNKTYVTAALQYPEIQTMVAQSGTVKLYPYKVNGDLKGTLLNRIFNHDPEYFKKIIETQLQLPKTEREAIHIGVHGTGNSWIKFLQWVNITYGKGGDDSVWFPSQEEYYEYNYYRIHSKISIMQVDQYTIKLIIYLPSEQYFYYPSISINLTGLQKENISVSSNSIVTGLSYGNYGNGITLNVDCRKSLVEHATYFVERFEKDKTNNLKKSDAAYFVNMLKESDIKKELINRIE